MTKIGCPFCNPLTRVVKANKSALVILSDPRKVPGHILVVPKKHIEKPWQLTSEQITDIFKLIAYVEKRIIGPLGEGADIRQNYRPYIKQSAIKLDHIQFQIIPRSKGDYISKVENQESSIFAELDDLEREEVTKLLKS